MHLWLQFIFCCLAFLGIKHGSLQDYFPFYWCLILHTVAASSSKIVQSFEL